MEMKIAEYMKEPKRARVGMASERRENHFSKHKHFKETIDTSICFILIIHARVIVYTVGL